MGALFEDDSDMDVSQADDTGENYSAPVQSSDYDLTGLTNAYSQVGKSSEAARKVLQEARARIMAQKYDKTQMLLAISSGLLSPTRTGNFFESFGNMSNALQGPVKDRAQFAQQQQKDLFGIDTGLVGLDEKLAQSALSLEGLKAKLSAQAANAPLEKVVVGGQKKLVRRRDAEGKEFFVPPTASTNIHLNTEKNLYGKLGDKQAEMYSTMWEVAQKAPEAIKSTQRIQSLIAATPYTGSLADYKLKLGKALQVAGINYSKDANTNTEQLMTEMARAALANVKSSGLAGSQGLSEGERPFLMDAIAGRVQLEPKSILRLAELNARTARIAAEAWNKQFSLLDQDQMKILGMTPVDLDANSDPKVILWNDMPHPNGGNDQPPKQDIMRWQDWPKR